jgi:hypothetical protein
MILMTNVSVEGKSWAGGEKISLASDKWVRVDYENCQMQALDFGFRCILGEFLRRGQFISLKGARKMHKDTDNFLSR